MNPQQLRETTMDARLRSLIKITLPGPYEDRQPVKDLVERLMGKNPAPRFEFIQQRASAPEDEAIDA
jgi:topoisomerase-4 subunit B